MSYPGEQFDQEWRSLLFPSDYQNPRPQQKYHLVVIGAGPAGLIAAIGAAGLGAKVALVERQMMGGDCLNVGCVPSKALLEVTKTGATFDAAFEWLRKVRAGIAPHDSVARYASLGVDVFLGDASLTPAGDVTVGALHLNTRRAAICTGARAALPPIHGLAAAEPLTNESVFDLTHQPESIAVLGAGPIGCELATAFARLGTRVELFEMADHVLANEDEMASVAVAAALEDLGVRLHLNAPVTEVQRIDQARTEVVSGESRIECAKVLVALGRRPNTDGLNAAAAGIDLDDRGFVVTDAKLRTSNKKVFAAGDCTAQLQFTHHADAQARVVVQNALFAATASVDKLIVPHCTYTNPEVAGIGLNEAALVQAGVEFDCYECDFADLDRGRAEVSGGGCAKIYLKRGKDEILGATIVGHDAGEQIASIGLLMSNGLGLSAIGKTMISYPTRAEYLKRLFDAYNRTRLTDTVAKLFRFWLNRTG